MSLLHTISQEFLSTSVNKQFGLELLASVEALQDLVQASDMAITSKDAWMIKTAIEKHTKINADVNITKFDGPALIQEVIPGHNSLTGRYPHKTDDGRHSAYQDQFLNILVDLDKGRLGKDAGKLNYTLLLPTFLFETDDFTVREITAMILHEVGHAFFQLATMGEYVLLNYCLTDGMDVVLGNKPNKYKVDILDDGYLKKQLPPEERETLTTYPTKANYRRAILKAHETGPRLQLVSKWASIKRDEQLADMFASRMGFSKDLALAMYKAEKMVPSRYMRTKRRFQAVEVMKGLLFGLTAGSTFLLFPVTPLVLLAGVIHMDVDTMANHAYDNPKQRIVKIRHDLVAQLKDPAKSKKERQLLNNDIKAVDQLLATMNEHATLLESLKYVFRPSRRRDQQQLKHEELLEGMLHNDLYVMADRLRR